jgi:hypothetical protein
MSAREFSSISETIDPRRVETATSWFQPLVAPAFFRPGTDGWRVLRGGLIAGVLDATDGVVAFGLVLGMNPIQVLQYIASGMLGASAFNGGLLTATLGALLHFLIAFIVAYTLRQAGGGRCSPNVPSSVGRCTASASLHS